MSLWPWLAIPVLTGALGRFLLGTVFPGRYTGSHRAPTQGRVAPSLGLRGLSAQDHLRMLHSEHCLALSLPDSEVIFS